MSPSLRNPPFTGLEWSFVLKDEGYDWEGEKLEETEELEMQTLNTAETDAQQNSE